MTKKMLMIMASLMIFLFAINAFAYDDKKTHPALTEYAIEKSGLNDYLKEIIGISEGIKKSYNGKTIVELLQGGSTNEDVSPGADDYIIDADYPVEGYL